MKVLDEDGYIHTHTTSPLQVFKVLKADSGKIYALKTLHKHKLVQMKQVSFFFGKSASCYSFHFATVCIIFF